MNTWREKILNHFIEPVPALTLISDPDGLLLDGIFINQLAERGIELVDYHDGVAFRYLYEKTYLPGIMAGKLRLVVRTVADEDVFPYDLIKDGRTIRFQVTDIFPGLSAPVLRELGPEDFDKLCEAGGEYQIAASNAETCDLVLRRVYKVAHDTIVGPAELLKFLLAKHYQGHIYPKLIEEFLVERLSRQKAFKDIPLSELIHSQVAFYQYLQNEWENYLTVYKNTPSAREEKPSEGPYGEMEHALEDPEVRRLMDNLFTEGKLQPVAGYRKEHIPEWAEAGIVIDPKGDAKQRVVKLCRGIRERLKKPLDHWGWMQLAVLWGGVNEQVLAFGLKSEPTIISEVNILDQILNGAFQDWLLVRFGGLKNLPYLPEPVMVHQIPRFLSSKHRGRTALLVLDGMSWTQWLQISRHLRKTIGCRFVENSVFAWVPTITSISRQAIFTGEIPAYFANTIATTAKEESVWKLFWENQGIISLYTTYQKGLGKGDYPGSDKLWKSNTKVVGLVVDMLDQLGHAGLQGQPGLYAEIDLWLQNGYLENLITDLH